MPLDQLGAFMHAIGQQESGGNYDATGPYTGSTYGRAQGKYQIMETIYPSWAREAGVDPNDMSPAAQDKVASYKMTQYYNKYGRWDLVAIAWFAGPGRADKAAKHGIDSVGGISDVLGTDVRTYVNTMLGGMENAPSGGRKVEHPGGPTMPEPGLAGSTSPSGTMTQGGLPQNDPNAQFKRESKLNQETIEQIMGAMSSYASQGGGQLLDKQSMFGDIFTRTKGVE